MDSYLQLFEDGPFIDTINLSNLTVIQISWIQQSAHNKISPRLFDDFRNI